jgi:hypothetical protein
MGRAEMQALFCIMGTWVPGGEGLPIPAKGKQP